MNKEIDKNIVGNDAPQSRQRMRSNRTQIPNTRQIYNYVVFDNWKFYSVIIQYSDSSIMF